MCLSSFIYRNNCPVTDPLKVILRWAVNGQTYVLIETMKVQWTGKEIQCCGLANSISKGSSRAETKRKRDKLCVVGCKLQFVSEQCGQVAIKAPLFYCVFEDIFLLLVSTINNTAAPTAATVTNNHM